MLELVLANEADTVKLGRVCGQLLDALPLKRLVIGLTGTLGAGKTTFTAGLASALDVEEPVCSPTFTMLNEYVSGRVPLYHFDLYRIGEGISEHLLEDFSNEVAELSAGQGVFVVEWIDLFPELFTSLEDLRLHFSYREDGTRHVTVVEQRGSNLLQKISDNVTALSEHKASSL